MTKNLINLTLILTLSVFVSACTNATPPAPQPVEIPIEVVENGSSEEKLQANYQFKAEQDGQTALELISANAEVETQDYGDAGQFVTSINGLAGNNEYYWAFYVNDEYAEKGASQTILKNGDTIKFVYEAVTPTK